MSFLDFLAPKSCVFCGVSRRPDQSVTCAACYEELPWQEASCSPRASRFTCVIAPLHYAFPIDVAIKALKFHRKLYYVPAFVDILAAQLVLLPDDIDAVVPVPLHWRRELQRGFNQAAELAAPIAKQLNLPLLRGVRRRAATPFQSGLSASERQRNLAGVFACRRLARCRHSLIVDDIYTTGATANSLASALFDHGVQQVSLLTLARTS